MSTINRTMTLYAQEALQAFVANLAPLNAFSKDFSSVTAGKGSAVAVPLYENITATTFAQSYVGTGGTVNTVTVTLDKHRITTVDLTDVQQLNSDVTIAKFGAQQGKALARIVLTDIWSIVTSTNFGAVLLTTLNTNWSKTQVRQMRSALAANNVNPADCSLIINEDLFDALLGDTNILQHMQWGGMSPSVIQTGEIPRILGMPVYHSNIIPANAITLYGFAAHPDSICVAMRKFGSVVPDGHYEEFAEMADDESGVSMTMRVLYNPQTGKRHGNFECLFGYAAGLTLGLKMATGPTV
jgi:hypothetical protein